MEWLNLHTKTLDSEEVIGSDPVERGTWLMLLRYCIGQENGGVICDCKGWKDRKWQQLVRVTHREIATKSDLWSWDGDNLVVTHYPVEKETEVITNRLNGSRGGRPKTKTQKKPGGFESVIESVNPNETERIEIAETERKGIGKEGNGREEKKETPARDDVCTLDQALAFAKANVMPPISVECATQWHDHMLSIGWQINNMPICDWRAALRRWASKWNTNTQVQKIEQKPKHKGIAEDIPIKIL